MKKIILLAVLVFGYLCGFAQNNDGRRLKSCMWTCTPWAPGSTGDYEQVWVSGDMAPMLITGSSQYGERRYLISEVKVMELDEMLKKMDISLLNGYQALGGTGMLPTYNIRVDYDDNTSIVATWSVKKPSKKAKTTLKAIQDFFKSLAETSKPAPGKPSGKFESYSHSFVSDPRIMENRGYYYSLRISDGKPQLKVNEGGEDNPYVEVGEDVAKQVEQEFYNGSLHQVDQEYMPEWMMQNPIPAHSTEVIRFDFEGGSISSINFIPTSKNRETIKRLDAYLAAVYDAAPAKFPEGRMTYCSCAYTNYGLPEGEIRHSYYELIADEGAEPKVIYCEDRGGEPKKTEFRATEQDVKELSSILRDKSVFKLNGYNVDERMTGGTSYRIHMEFSSGEKLNATWFTHNPKALASEAYAIILQSLRAVTERK